MSLSLTWGLGFDQVEHLAEQILEGQGFDSHALHPLTLLFIEVLQLKHGQHPVSVHIHAAEPVLYTGDRQVQEGHTHIQYKAHVSLLHSHTNTFGGFFALSNYRKQTVSLN